MYKFMPDLAAKFEQLILLFFDSVARSLSPISNFGEYIHDHYRCSHSYLFFSLSSKYSRTFM